MLAATRLKPCDTGLIGSGFLHKVARGTGASGEDCKRVRKRQETVAPQIDVTAGETAPDKEDGMADNITERELREAFKASGLWRDGWNYHRAITTALVLRGMQNTVIAIRKKHGNPAPIQQALI